MALMTASIGAELIDALGLPKGCVKDVILHFPANGIVTATVQFAPQRDQLDKFLGIITRYELHEREDGQ